MIKMCTVTCFQSVRKLWYDFLLCYITWYWISSLVKTFFENDIKKIRNILIKKVHLLFYYGHSLSPKYTIFTNWIRAAQLIVKRSQSRFKHPPDHIHKWQRFCPLKIKRNIQICVHAAADPERAFVMCRYGCFWNRFTKSLFNLTVKLFMLQ